MYIRVIGKEIEAFHGQKVILFGGGSCGLRALEEFEKNGAVILGFCDNNEKLHGLELNGYKIISPQNIKDYPDAEVIITSTFEEEIEDQLIHMGIGNYYRIKLGVLKETQPKDAFHNKVLTRQQANQSILEGLRSAEPFFIGRLGSVELECLTHYLYFLDRRNCLEQSYPDNVKMMMNINAGFFPSEDVLLDEFCRLYLSRLNEMDIIWSMWFSKFENKIYSEYKEDTSVADYDETVFPYDQDQPWTLGLKGRKVLVIHPFEESIRENYKIKDKLFGNPEFLPDFELITLKAVQSIAGNKTPYETWFEALKDMEDKMDRIDYDIALIGAGAYGLALGAHAKRVGKKAVHIGGILQLFFGIKGKAWNKLGVYNEHWTSPLETEVPQDFKKVEAGRYW